MARRGVSIQKQFILIFLLAAVPAFVVFGIVSSIAEIHFSQTQVDVQNETVKNNLLEFTRDYQQQSVRALKGIEHMLNTLSASELETQGSLYLESLQLAFPYFKSIQILDLGGIVRLAVPKVPGLAGTDDSRQAFFIGGKQGILWSSAFIYTPTGTASVTLSGLTGRFLSVIYLDLSPLQDSLSAIDNQESRSISITDATDTIVADSDGNRVLRREKFPFPSNPGNSGSYRVVQAGGTPARVSVVPVGDTGWKIYIVQSEEAVYGPIRSFGIVMALALLLSLGGASVLIVLHLRSFAKEVSNFIAATSQIGKGAYERIDVPASPNEMRLLAERFNEMVESIYQREERILQLNTELERRVKERTLELERSNNDLKRALDVVREAQDQLVESEKMAAVGLLVAGVAHEINTPVGISLTASTYVESRTREIRKAFDGGNLAKADFEEFLNSMQESGKIISRNLDRASELIRSFKQVAADHSVDEKREFSVKEYFAEVVQNLTPSFKKRPVHVTIEVEGEIRLFTYPAGFSQILTNLIMNSLIHGFDENQEGTIRIQAAIHGNDFVLTYTDDGKGIDPEIRHRIFEPFFTTRRQEGSTGLGMHIVYNIVRNQLAGSIAMESGLKSGVKFVITMPLDASSMPQRSYSHAQSEAPRG